MNPRRRRIRRTMRKAGCPRFWYVEPGGVRTNYIGGQHGYDGAPPCATPTRVYQYPTRREICLTVIARLIQRKKRYDI